MEENQDSHSQKKPANQDDDAGSGGAKHGTDKPKRILVVDDNKDAADTMSRLLQYFGHKVFQAYDGIEAVAAVGEHDPDIVLLDIGLPGIDGYQAAREIRRTESRHIVLAAVTGYSQEEDRKKATEAGFDYCLIKPVDLATIREVIASV